MDFRLVEQILKRSDRRYCGMIGSETKRKRFLYRLGGRGMPESALAQLRCPIGLPAETAVSIAAEIITLYQDAELATTPPDRLPEAAGKVEVEVKNECPNPTQDGRLSSNL